MKEDSRHYPAAFFAKVNRHGPIPNHAPHLGECWEWTGRLHRLGYGAFGRTKAGSISSLAHRRHWIEVVGPLAPGIDLDHLCRNRRCVRLNHLEPVTHKENCRRGLNGALHVPRTECKRGHVYPFPGSTYCRECQRLRKRATRGSTQLAPGLRTACPQGHPYDSVGGHGERACSACLRRQKLESYHRRKAARSA